MLSDWFFASCVTKNPDKIAAFLSILETLDDPENTERLKIDSFHELAKSEVWFQVYAFNKVLDMRRYGDRNSLNGQVQTAFDTYINAMLDHAPEEVESDLENLLRDYFYSQSGDLSPSCLLDSFVSSAQGLVTKLSIRAFTPVPYLDINDYLPETILLSLLLNKVQTDSTFRVSFQISFESDPAFVVVRQIIEKALDYQLGRLSLLIAIKLAILIDTLGYTRDKIIETIIRNRLNIDYEPDLLQAYAELCFTDIKSSSKLTNNLSVIKSIISETISFNLLQTLQQRLHNGPGSERTSLGYVGLTTPSTRLAFLLPLAYWQSTLWELAVQIDPNTAGVVLAEYWRIPETTKQTIELKSTISNRKYWQKEIDAFIEMRGLKEKLQISVINGQPGNFPEDAQWVISSPWLLSEKKAKHINSPESMEGEKRRIVISQYYDSDRPEAIIRLLVASIITTRILQKYTSENSNFAVLVSLISHATDVIENDFNWLLKNFRDDRCFDEFPLPFIGFLLFARRQLNYLGRGYWNSVDPNSIVDIVRGKNQLRSDYQSKYGRKFLEKCLPETMIRWIESAYTGVIDKTGPGRWIPLIPEVCSYYKAGHSDITIHSNKNGLLNCTLIEKYLSHSVGINYNEEFDWQKIGSDGQSWDIDYHFLLISEQGLPPSAWLRREWQEPVWETNYYKPLTRLVRSLERVVSLGYGDNISSEICGQWKNDWIKFLDAIHEQRDLDRFVRIRLIQLIDNPIFAEQSDGLMIISNIILEYGCTYDLKLLLDKIFPLNDLSFYNRQSSPAFRNMQISVIQSLCAFVDNYIDNDDEKNYYIDIQDPKQKRREYQKYFLYKEYLAKIAYISWLNQKQGVNINFSDYIEKYRYNQKEKASKWKYRISKADLEDTGGSQRLIINVPDQKVHEWNLCCAVVNPNELTTNLFYQDLDTDGAQNLFSKSRQELVDIKNSGKRLRVLSVLVAKEMQKNGTEKYTFNVGFDFYLSIIRNSLQIERGDYVLLEIFKDLEKERWIIERNQSFALIKKCSREGDIALAKINESIALGYKKLTVEVNDEYITDVDLPLWDADISRSYSNQTLLKDKCAFVRFSKENSWIPIELDLADLLRNGFGQPCQDSCVLTFIREKIDTGTECSWIFSREPGENYLLFDWQFTDESVTKLQEEIDNYSDPAGLLVVIEPIEIDGRVVLQLGLERTNETIAQYEKLDSPFDTRNIQWKEVFQISRIAEKKKDIWSIDITDTKISGFPTSINVHWNRYYLERNENKVEISVIEWNDKDQRINTVRAEQIYSHRILPKDKDWSSFYDKWTNLKTGDKLSITKPWKYIESGMILAWTEENISVMLEPETVTFGALSIQNCPQFATPREGEITRIVWGQRCPLCIEIPDLEERLNEEQELIGIFVEIPGSKDGGTLCKLKWKINGQIINTDVQVEGVTKLNITIGSKLFAYKSDSTVRYTYSKPSIIVSLLWSISDWSEEDGDFIIVGSSEIGNEKYILAEEKSDPGKIYKFPVRFSKYPFLSTGNGREFSGGISPEMKLNLTQKGNPWKKQNNSLLQRVSLSYSGKMLFGIVKGRIFEKDVHLSNIVIKVLPSNYQDRFILQREFTLFAVKKAEISKRIIEQDSKLLCAKLQEYFIQPYNVDAFYKDGTIFLIDLQTPIDQTETKWTSELSIAVGEGTFLVDPDYSQAATVRIIKENNNYSASLRMVPPLLPDEFRIAVGADYNDDSYRLEVPLFYVGKEDSNPFTGEEGIFHRFEWGYGKSVIIPNEYLRYNGGPFDLSQMVLFYGDSVTKIVFKEIQDLSDNNVIDQSNMCYFEICDQNIQFSKAHTLFYQKSKFQMLHTLKLHITKKEVSIVDIEGFEESQLSSHELSFDQVQAVLSEHSKVELLQRYNEVETPELINNDIYILGRFNEDEYKGSLGKIVTFDHVNLSFNRLSNEQCLHNNELLFMEAGEIKTGFNDMGLLIYPLRKINQREIGADFQNPIFLLRRNFSVREDLLPQINNREGKGALKKSILLVRLSKNNERMFSSIRKNIPSRKTQALATAISQKAITFANIEDITPHSIRLEVKPGVYVDLKNSQIDGNPSGFEKGDIVRLENSGHNVFRLIRSIFSDKRYVPQYGTRRAVALPKNLLLKKQTWETDDVTKDKFWKDQNLFTIGGLPNIQAMMGDPENEFSNQAHLASIRAIELMQKPHPKIVEIKSECTDKFVIKLPEQDVFCGRLDFSPDLRISYSPVSGPNFHLLSDLDWKKISFGDESKLDIINRCKKFSWSYHDKKTGIWSKDKKEVEIVDINLQTPETGPLFFEENDGNLLLRYSKQRLIEFGYPARELIHLLRVIKKGRFPIAGVTTEKSIWLEILPGRIIEISMNLVSWRIGQKLVSMENFDYSKLSIGDELELELDNTDILSPDILILQSWIPGPRGSFGPQQCYLPVQSIDETNTFTRLGIGEYSLIIPDTITNFGNIMLNENNDVSDASSTTPQSGDVILLGLNEVGDLNVIGFPQYSPRPEQDDENAWTSDPLLKNILKKNQYEKFEFKRENLVSLIKIMNGAIPMTVEHISTKGNIFLSRKYQWKSSIINDKKLIPAIILGLMNDGQTVVLKAGSGIILVNLQELVFGIPKRFYQQVVDLLIANRSTFWLRGTENGNYVSGIADELSHDPYVHTVCEISEGVSAPVSLVVQSIDSMKYYWLATSKLAWTQLVEDEIHRVYHPNKNFKMRIVSKDWGHPSSSVIDLHEIQQDLGQIKVGKQITIEIISERKNEEEEQISYLAKSVKSGALLECCTHHSQPLKVGDFLTVEVTSKIISESVSVTAVPSGNRQHKLDLPKWQLLDWPAPGELREQLQNYLSLSIINSSLSEKKPEQLEDSELDLLLRDSYKYILNNPIVKDIPILIAQEWYKRNHQAREVFLPYSIMTILILDAYSSLNFEKLAPILGPEATNYLGFTSDWKGKASFLLRDIGRRAIRSMHVEVLSDDWILNKTNRPRRDGLWDRLSAVEGMLKAPIQIECIHTIQRLNEAVNIRSDNDIISISDSLLATIGSLERLDFILQRAYVTNELIKLCATIPTTKSGIYPNLHATHREKLKSILDSITIQALDITLLYPLPKIEY